MRGDIVFKIGGMHEGRKDDVFFGTFRTLQEAQDEVEKLTAKEMNGQK